MNVKFSFSFDDAEQLYNNLPRILHGVGVALRRAALAEYS